MVRDPDGQADTARHPQVPPGACFDPTRRLLWCTTSYHSGYYRANGGRRTELTVIDPDSRRIVEVVGLAPEHGPHGLALDAARGLLYVSVEGSADWPGGVVVVDTRTRKPLGRRLAYVSGAVSSTVDIVDLESLRTVGRLDTAKLGQPGAHGLAYVPRPA